MEKITKDVKLTNAAKEARRAYKRQWAKNNPDKVRAAQARFWERQAQRQTVDQIPEAEVQANA